MNYRVATFLLLGLWIATIGLAANFFIRGQTIPTSDGRVAILLPQEERQLVLGEMRNMLSSVRDIISALAENDRKKVAIAARASGMQAAVDINPTLMAKLPFEFKQLGMSMHGGFDDLASAAEKGANKDELLLQLNNRLTGCVGCHAGYRIDPAEVQKD